MKKIILLNVFIWFTTIVLVAQGWQKVIGLPGVNEEGKYISRTNDGGYLVRCKIAQPGNNQSLLYRLDVDGDLLWTFTFPAFYTYSGKIVTDPTNNIYSVSNASWSPQTITNEVFRLSPEGILVKKFSIGEYDLAGALPDGLIVYAAAGDSLKLRKYNFFGNLIWSKQYLFPGFSMLEMSADGRLYAGAIGSGQPMRIKAFSPAGQLFWDYTADANLYTRFALLPGGHVLLYGNEDAYEPEGTRDVYLQKVSSTGLFLWNKVYLIKNEDYIDRINPLENGNFLLSGHKLYVTTHIMPRFYCLNAQGEELWKRIINSASFVLFADAVANPDGSVVNTGYQLETPYSLTGNKNLVVWKISADGLILPNILRGRVVADDNADCVAQNAELGLKNWKIQINDLLTVTDAEGRYEISTDTGNVQLQLYPPGDYWEPCAGYENIAVTGIGQVDSFDIPVTPLVACPQMEVNISFPFLRRCAENTATVNWCNFGTAATQDARVLIVLPPELDFVSATRPVEKVAGDSLWFNVGSVNPNDCGSFQLTALADCDSAAVGQSLCVSAHITPDSFCIVNPAWTGAHLELSSRCVGDTVVAFSIKNTGNVISSPALEYIIIEDQVVLLTAPIPPLAPSQEFTILQPVGMAGLYRLEAEQEPFYPGKSTPSTWVEGCGLPENQGLALQYTVDDNDLFTDIDCHEVLSAIAPNEKIATPAGYDVQHFIKPNTDLTFRISFQNTGSDTAFTIIVRDTLSPWLDPTTLRPEVASAPYTWSIEGANVVKFVFGNIKLPGYKSGEDVSRGFIQFRISQKNNVPENTVITNSADVYLDLAPPMFTNQTYHTVGSDFLLFVPTQTPANGGPACTASPNPFRDATTVYFDRAFTGEFLLMDAQKGILRRQTICAGNSFYFERRDLPPGVYFFEFRSAENTVLGGKIVAQ